MMIIQAILLLFFLGALTRVWWRFRRHELDLSLCFLWTMVWLMASVLVVLPNTSARLAELVGIGRGADLAVYSAVALLFFMNFQLNVKIERLNKDVATLTRQLALAKIKNEKI